MIRKAVFILILTVAVIATYSIGDVAAGDKKCPKTKVEKTGKCAGTAAKAAAGDCPATCKAADHSKCKTAKAAAGDCPATCKAADHSKCKTAKAAAGDCPATCKAADHSKCKTAKAATVGCAATCKAADHSKCKTAKAATVGCAATCKSACKTKCKPGKAHGKNCAGACCSKDAHMSHAKAVGKVADDIPYRETKRLVLTGNVLCGGCQLEGITKCQPMVKTDDGKMYPLVRNAMVKKMGGCKGSDTSYKIKGRVKKVYGVKYLDVTSYSTL